MRRWQVADEVLFLVLGVSGIALVMFVLVWSIQRWRAGRVDRPATWKARHHHEHGLHGRG